MSPEPRSPEFIVSIRNFRMETRIIGNTPMGIDVAMARSYLEIIGDDEVTCL